MPNRILISLILLVYVASCSQNPIDSELSSSVKTNDFSAQAKERIMQLGCDLTIKPRTSINSSLGKLASGETLCLGDGIYEEIVSIPSTMSLRALNVGKVEIDGRELNAGYQAVLMLHGNNSSVSGIKVHHASRFADTCSIKGEGNHLSSMSCSHGGKHKHKIPLKVSGVGHLIEDSWFYGEGRYVVQCFRGRSITFRRNVARWDSTIPNQRTEPNAAYSIYNCSNITVENNISIDYGLAQTPMKFGADFYGPQNRSIWPEGNQNNYWLGNIAINHAKESKNRRALRLDPSTTLEDNFVTDLYVRGSDYGTGGNSRTSKLKVGRCTMINVKHTGRNGNRRQIVCTGPADISKRYVDRKKTKIALFPWKNEQLIKNDMCAANERQSDWCGTSLSLTDYVLHE
ncbi:MAG: hypothetical protein L3J46_05055 [Kangiellaceae bacterium]|nr:hypothetical protein [Kangiellaceae bacterium]